MVLPMNILDDLAGECHTRSILEQSRNVHCILEVSADRRLVQHLDARVFQLGNAYIAVVHEFFSQCLRQIIWTQRRHDSEQHLHESLVEDYRMVITRSQADLPFGKKPYMKRLFGVKKGFVVATLDDNDQLQYQMAEA